MGETQEEEWLAKERAELDDLRQELREAAICIEEDDKTIGSLRARVAELEVELGRRPGPATRKLIKQLLEYRRAPGFEGCTSVAIRTDGPTARAFLEEWEDVRR